MLKTDLQRESLERGISVQENGKEFTRQELIRELIDWEERRLQNDHQAPSDGKPVPTVRGSTSRSRMTPRGRPTLITKQTGLEPQYMLVDAVEEKYRQVRQKNRPAGA